MVRPENDDQLRAIKAVLKVLNVDFVTQKGKAYDPEFVEKIQESRKQAKAGKVSSVRIEDLWK